MTRALVTGAGTRLGRVFAIALAEAGYDIVVHYFSNEKGAEETCREVERRGRTPYPVQADLSQADGPRELVRSISTVSPSLDVLVNNASVYPSPDKVLADHNLLQESVEDWEKSITLNARAPFFLIQECTPLLERASSPHIVNILDMSITDPFIDRASHSVSKAALAAITTIAAETLKPQIRVNALELGPILPGDLMPESEVKKVRWLGVDVVAAAFRQLLEVKQTGQIVRVV